MIRQLDNIKFALLLPEFVYGKEGRSGGKEGAGLSQHMAGQPIPPAHALYIPMQFDVWHSAPRSPSFGFGYN